jgi:hypothetical protein
MQTPEAASKLIYSDGKKSFKALGNLALKNIVICLSLYAEVHIPPGLKNMKSKKRKWGQM